MTPLFLACLGFACIVGAWPVHLRARGRRGTSAIRPRWLVRLGFLCFLASAVMALLEAR